MTSHYDGKQTLFFVNLNTKILHCSCIITAAYVAAGFLMCAQMNPYLSDSFKRAPFQLLWRVQSDFLSLVFAHFGLRIRHVVRRRRCGLEFIVKSVSRESFPGVEDKQMAGGRCVKAAAGGDLNVGRTETPQKRVVL